MNAEERKKYNKTIEELVPGDLYCIRPCAQIFAISESDLNLINREDSVFVFLERYKIMDNIPIPDPQKNAGDSDNIDYIATFLCGINKYVIKIKKNAKYFCKQT